MNTLSVSSHLVVALRFYFSCWKKTETHLSLVGEAKKNKNMFTCVCVCVLPFTFTFSHLADAFVQSDVQHPAIQVYECDAHTHVPSSQSSFANTHTHTHTHARSEEHTSELQSHLHRVC